MGNIDDLLAQLPDVDPDSPDLSDLRAWCLAVKRLGGVTDEESERLLQMAKRIATLPESELTDEELEWKARLEPVVESAVAYALTNLRSGGAGGGDEKA